MFVAAVLYTIALLRISQRESRAVEKEFEDMCGIEPEETCGIDAITRRQREKRARLKYAVMLVAGMGITVIGADWMVTGAIGIARTLNISDALIGLTIVAIGTSSPELATTVVATIRKERDVAVGNLLGSSIYNILVILGLTCMISPGGLPVTRELMLFDIPLMTGVALACVPVFLRGKCISRVEGGVGVATLPDLPALAYSLPCMISGKRSHYASRLPLIMGSGHVASGQELRQYPKDQPPNLLPMRATLSSGPIRITTSSISSLKSSSGLVIVFISL